MYGCERWTIKKAEHWRTDIFELWCWRRLLKVPWTTKETKPVNSKGNQFEYSLEGLILKLKLQCFGHLMRTAVAAAASAKSLQSCPTLCNPMKCSTPGLPVHHQLSEFIQTHVHRVGDAIQPSHPWSSLFSPAHSPSQHQSLFQWVNSSHEVAKVLEFQL